MRQPSASFLSNQGAVCSLIRYTFEVVASNNYIDKNIQILVFGISIILDCKQTFIKDLNLVPGHKLIIARI